MIKNRDIFIFSLSDWSEEMVSNRYQMAMRFSKNNRVFFFERPIIPWTCDLKRWPEYFVPVEEKQKNFYLIKPPSALSYEGQKKVSVFYIQTLIALFHIKKPIFWFYDFSSAYLINLFSPDLSCYHCTEYYRGVAALNGSKHQDEIIGMEDELVTNADLIFAVSQEITRKHKENNASTYPTLNAVNYELYKNAQNDSQEVFGSNKVVGYVGNISLKLDFEILDFIAAKLPNITLVLAGPVSIKNDYLRSLKKRKNVRFLPKQKVENLPALIREFDVCLIPYIQDGWFVKAAQPLKLLEYMASGKPIVATPMDCLKKMDDLVYIGANKYEYLKKVKLALKERSPNLHKKRTKFAQKNTWDDRFEFINKKMEECLVEKTARHIMPTLKDMQTKKLWLIKDYGINQKATELFEEGEKILNHTFTVLNKTRKFGSEIDWSAAFESKKSWVKGYFEKLNQVTYSNGFNNPNYIGDVKLVWEFNKHLHFVKLAQCYNETNDEKYAQEFIKEVLSWIEQNPYEYNHAWTQTLIVSHRAISWVIALGSFIKSLSMTEEIWTKIFESLNQHAGYIEKYYEIGEKSSNHLLGNLAAQIVLCSAFPEIRDSRLKMTRALKMLEKELEKQIYPDGSDYEQSLSYHRVVLEFLLLVGLVDQEKMVKISSKIKNKIKKMAEFLKFAAQPSGFYQPISDADGARVFMIENDVLDARPYLQIASKIFGKIPAKTASKVYPDSGYAFLRKNWSKSSPWMFFDAGPISMGKNPENIELGTHGHSDTLNFGLALGEQTIITDIGSYAYTTERKFHHYFRSGFGHNIPIIDGQDENILSDSPWVMKQTAQGKGIKYQFSNDIDYVSGEHDGYKRLKNPVVLKREIIFNKKQNWAAVVDNFQGEGGHEITELFHLYPGLKTKTKNGVIEVNSNQKLKIIPFFESVINTVSGQENSPEGWYALDYGLKVPAEVIKIKTKINASQTLITLLNWGEFDIKLERVKKILENIKEKSE